MFTTEQKQLLVAFGNHLRELREQKGLTQSQTAFELETTTKHYQRIEYGQVNTSLLKLQKLAEIFEMDLPDLMRLLVDSKKNF